MSLELGVSTMYQERPKKKFCLAVFNRATYSRCKSLIKRIAAHPDMHITVALSNSLLMKEYGNAQEYIKSENKNVQFDLVEIQNNGSTHAGVARTAADIGLRFAEYFAARTFDAVILVADRYETLPCAIAASYQNIPIIHIQGGEVTGNIDEKIRHAVSKMADYHFVATDLAKDYLREMGEDYKRVFNPGCPSIDVIRQAHVKRWYPKEKYILSIFHPETERPDEAFEQTEVVLRSVIDYCGKYGARCYWYWPNPDPGREEIIKLVERAHIEHKAFLVKAVNKPPESFLTQLAGAKLIIGNSSCGIRECSYLGVPAINVGARQNLRERSWNVIDVGFNQDQIFQAMEEQSRVKRYNRSYLYGDGRAAEYIINQFDKIDAFTLKGSLPYPLYPKYVKRHTGEERFAEHKSQRIPIKQPKPTPAEPAVHPQP